MSRRHSLAHLTACLMWCWVLGLPDESAKLDLQEPSSLTPAMVAAAVCDIYTHYIFRFIANPIQGVRIMPVLSLISPTKPRKLGLVQAPTRPKWSCLENLRDWS